MGGFGGGLVFVPGTGNLVANWDDGVKAWDCRSWNARILYRVEPRDRPVNRVACSADGRLLAVAQGPSLRLCDARSGEVIATLPEEIETFAYSLAFSPDGRFVAAGGIKGEVKIWDVIERKVEKTFKPHSFFVMGLAFSPDGRFLASGGSDQYIDLWHVDSQPRWEKAAELFGHGNQIWNLAFASDNTLISASRDWTVKFWDPQQIRKAELIEANAIVNFTENGAGLLSLDTNAAVRLWDIASSRLVRVVKEGESRLACNGALSPDGTLVAIAFRDGAVEIRSSSNGQLQHTMNIGHTNNVRFLTLKFSPDGRHLAAAIDTIAESNGGFAIWETATGERSPLTDLIHESAVGVAFSRRGNLLAFGTRSGRLVIWNLQKNRRLIEWQADSVAPYDVAFSPDDRILATSSADAKLWRAATGERIATLRSQTIGVTFLSFSPDGRTLATAGMDNTVTLWHVASLQELFTFHWEGKFLGRLFFSPDGNTLAAGALLFDGPGGRAQLWRAPSLTEIDATPSRIASSDR
jgi:WD40 repeat protein